jgi:hypothetical protein
MPRLPFEKTHINKLLMLAILLGSVPFPGCGNPGAGTIQVAPRARHLGSDRVTKQRPDVEKYKPKAAPAPVEPGKLPPGRGRMSE